MTQLSLWLEAQALLQDIVGWGHPRAGSLQATLDLSFKSWANLFGDFHLGVGVKPLLIFCLCDHTLLVVGVFVCSVLGRASLDCAGWENSTCTTWAHFPFMDWTIQDWLWDTRFILFQEPGQSGSLHLALEVEFQGYNLSDLLLVETYLLLLSRSMSISTRIGWLRHLSPLSPNKGVFLYLLTLNIVEHCLEISLLRPRELQPWDCSTLHWFAIWPWIIKYGWPEHFHLIVPTGYLCSQEWNQSVFLFLCLWNEITYLV